MAHADIAVGAVPAHNTDAEQALLGAVFLEQSVLDDVRPIIRLPEMFYRTLHRMVWAAMLAIHDANQEINWIAVGDWLSRQGYQHDRNDLVAMTERMAMSAGAIQWATIVRDRYIQREFGRLGAELTAEISDPTADANETIERVQSAVMALQAHRETRATVDARGLIALTQAELDRYEQGSPEGITTGFPDLNRITGGFQAGELVIVAARPGVGKTVLLMQMAYHAAESHGAVINSLEMGNAEVGKRLLASISGVSLWHLTNRDKMAPDMRRDEKDAYTAIAKRRLFLHDDPNMNVADIRSHARRLVSEHGIKVVAVDYLQLVQASQGRGRNNRQRHEEVGEMTRGLKLMARELGIVVIAAAQLNRQIEGRGDNAKPRLSDLRESGSIEQDADKVLFIVPPPKPKEGEPADAKALTEFDLAKNRNGPIGAIKVFFRKECSRFEDAAKVAPDGFTATGNRRS